MKLIFISEGGFGNQLFQYAYLYNNFNSHKKIIFGFDDLKHFIKIKNTCVISSRSKVRKFLWLVLLRKCLDLISFLRIISSYKVNKKEDYERVENIKEGIFKKIIYHQTGYFQSEKYFKRNFKIYINKNRKKENSDTIFDSNAVLVHIRQGDYFKYKVFGKPSILPPTYFKKGVLLIEKKIQNPHFHIFSDSDLKNEYLDVFKGKNITLNIKKNQYKTFDLMMNFSNAIISPSSFSWWATYLMNNKKNIIVPKYWLGFHSKRNYPENPFCNYMNPITFDLTN